MKIVTQKPLWQILAGIIFSLMVFSNSAYAELPKAIQADKYILLISDSLKREKYEDALKYIEKLEGLKDKIPDAIIYFKGESWFHTYKWDNAKETLENYLTKTGAKGKYYKQALVLLGKLEKNIVLNKHWIDMAGTPLHYVAKRGILFKVKSLLDSGAYSVNERNKWEITPLSAACAQGNYQVAKELIARGAMVNVKSKWGNTPLSGAANAGGSVIQGEESRYFETVELLIKNGADVNANSEGMTPLHHSAGRGKIKISELLITSGAKLNIMNKRYQTPLDLAIQYERNNIVVLLKKYGAKTGAELKSSLK